MIATIADAAIKQFDSRSGGLVRSPSFLTLAPVDLLLDISSRSSTLASPDLADKAKMVALVTLEKMSRGGIYDHLAGGFHRYSVDEGWVVPHFEKMAYDNSELLKNYVHAYQSFVEPECARVAKEIIRWMDEWLSDRERGKAFTRPRMPITLSTTMVTTSPGQSMSQRQSSLPRSSRLQDRSTISKVRSATCTTIQLRMCFTFARPLTASPRANGIGFDVARGSALAWLNDCIRLVSNGRSVRRQAVYVGWNGMCVSAYLDAGRVLDLPAVREFALKSLDRVLASAWDAEQGLSHVVSYGEARSTCAGTLEDYAFLRAAALECLEATGGMRYYDAAQSIAER